MKLARLFVLLTMCLALSGCWDHQPLENTAFIITLGLDVDPDNREQTVVTQLAVLPATLAAGDTANQPEGTPFYLLSNSAHTLEAAQIAVVNHLSRLPRLDHVNAIVLGEDFARRARSVEPALAWVLRHPQLRPDTRLFVVEGTAQQFMDARPALDPLPGAALAGLMRHSDRVPYMFPVHAFEFARALLSPRMDAAIPMVRRVNPLAARVPPEFEQQPFVGLGNDGGGGEGTSGSSEPMDSQIKLVGMAIFKGSKMVGSLMEEDLKGLRWIRGDSKGPVSIRHPKHRGAYIVGIAISSRARLGTRLDDDRVTLTIDIHSTMDIWGEGILEPMGVGRHREEIQRELQDTVETQVRETMEHLQRLEADIFGFGELLYRSSPKDWDKVAHRWDRLYADAELDVKVQATIRRTGLSR